MVRWWAGLPVAAEVLRGIDASEIKSRSLVELEAREAFAALVEPQGVTLAISTAAITAA